MSTELDGPLPTGLDLAQLRASLEQARNAERSHYLWSMVGLSPVGILLLFSAFVGGPGALAWAVVFVLAFVVQFRRWKASEREVKRLEELLNSGD